MSRDAASTPRPTITVRPTPEEKVRFTALAAASGQSESDLGLEAVRLLLRFNPEPPSIAPVPPLRESAVDRITIRLRPGDRRVIAGRASARDMKAATYIAALVRAHIAANPPLAAAEFHAFKQGIVVTAGFGRLLAQHWRRLEQAGALSADIHQELARTREVVATFEERMHDFVKAAMISWESRSG